MKTIKFFISMLPDSLRKRMRSQLWLYNLYSNSLHKSGLFYGVPSQKKLQKLYLKIIEQQSKLINEKSADLSEQFEIDCFIYLTDSEQANDVSLAYLQISSAFSNTVLLGEDKLVKKLIGRFEDQFTSKLMSFNSWKEAELRNSIFLIRSGDVIHPQAVQVFYSYFDKSLADQIIYCDCDALDESGKRHEAQCFPDWNPDLQLTTGYVQTGIFVSGTNLIDSLVRFIPNNMNIRVWSLWLVECYLSISSSVSPTNNTQNIIHIPISLLHKSLVASGKWGELLGSAEFNCCLPFKVENTESKDVATLSWANHQSPLVSLIIPTKNAKYLVKNCIESILNKTRYQAYEILLIDNNSDDPESLDYFAELAASEPKVTVLKYPYPFNYSAINNFAVKHAQGEVIGLVNNDIEVINDDWLTHMVYHASREDIGCVGAKLLYPDDRIQHAGVVMGYGGGAGHAHKYFPDYHPGYLNRLIATHNYSAVTAACLLVTKSDYESVGGLNETQLTVAFNDVDFCLKVLGLGRHNLYCAEAKLYHHESVSRGLDNTVEKRQRFEQELDYLQRSWKNIIQSDPAYNPNLTLRRENFSLKES